MCASCQMSIPDDVISLSMINSETKLTQNMRLLRTVEELHACTEQCERQDDGNTTFKSYLHVNDFSVSQTPCHKHRLVYSSSPSPAISSTYSTLRNATIRTLSGEQLPRGHKSGPIYFGDASTGYTIAYVFRIMDPLARGHHRFYAFLALAGSDGQRAAAACACIWSLFEQIARNVVQTAEHVVAKKASTLSNPCEAENVIPISSFLARSLSVDQDGFSRRGTTNVRPNGIAELVGNPNFFCELHMTFVGMIRDLGKFLGGLQIMPAIRYTLDTDGGDRSSTQLDLEDAEDPEDRTGEASNLERHSADIAHATLKPDLPSLHIAFNSSSITQTRIMNFWGSPRA